MGRTPLRGPGLAAHLVRRFAGALDPRGPRPADEAWAVGHLRAGEVALWRRMSGPDRRHAVGVAHRAVAELGGSLERPWVAAALLHDVGKVESGLGTLARVPATLVGLAVPRTRVARWSGRLGAYLRHDEVGAALLRAAGSDPRTVAWAEQHHRPPARRTVPPAVGAALERADDG